MKKVVIKPDFLSSNQGVWRSNANAEEFFLSLWQGLFGGEKIKQISYSAPDLLRYEKDHPIYTEVKSVAKKRSNPKFHYDQVKHRSSQLLVELKENPEVRMEWGIFRYGSSSKNMHLWKEYIPGLTKILSEQTKELLILDQPLLYLLIYNESLKQRADHGRGKNDFEQYWEPNGKKISFLHNEPSKEAIKKILALSGTTEIPQELGIESIVSKKIILPTMYCEYRGEKFPITPFEITRVGVKNYKKWAEHFIKNHNSIFKILNLESNGYHQEGFSIDIGDAYEPPKEARKSKVSNVPF